MTFERQRSGLSTLGAMGIGAALMYFLDPGRGARRRALVRDKAMHLLNKTADAADTTRRDLRNRARGLAAEVRGRFEHEDVDDPVLVARVRAEMGRAVSHPSAILTTAIAGRVTLSGPILANEAHHLLSHVRSVRGVREVVDRLERHDTPGGVPGLQGGITRRSHAHEMELLQDHWSPAARLLVGAAGGALALAGAERRDVLGGALSLAGLALLSRSLSNMPLRDVVGAGHRGISIQNAINITGPLDEVFAFFTNYENFPHFMSHVREVRATGDETSHWVVDGPAGVPIEWDAVLTDLEPNEILGWASVPGSIVDNAGVIRFWDNEDGTAHVDVKMTYKPPAGAIGHAVARLLGADPRKEMDDDLARVKTYLETGRAPHDAAQPNDVEVTVR
jgi:uncharacterized membrane protein